jgi:CO/xanthine dehydrogenase Mo-binding subunit
MIANDRTALSRRAFLSASGALVVALAAPAELARAASDSIDRSIVRPDKLSSYISIDRDGIVTAYYGKIDGGQGLESAIAQLVAEEIDVPWERVRMVMGDTALTVDMGGATAGNGVRQGGIIMRQTAAEARRLLIEMAGKKLNLAVSDLTVTDGVVHVIADPSKRISYAELVGGRTLDEPIAWSGLAQQLAVKVKAPLKQPSEFKVIGKPMRRRDIAGKVFGTLQQCSDVRLPNMAHARMIRPQIAGAVPVAVDEKSIAAIPGARVVWIKDFLALVAEKEWNAVKAAQALKVTWSESKPNFPGHEKLFDHIRHAPVVATSADPHHAVGAATPRRIGSVEDGFRKAVRILEGEYEYPTQSHASMGPACAVADVRDGRATVWTSTQKPHDCAAGIAELLDLPPQNVRAIWMFGTGGYARDGQGDATADAAVLSRHLGRPVRVMYSRKEALAWDPKGTALVNRSRVGLDASGGIIAYENISKAFSMEDCNTREQHPGDTLAGMALGAPLNSRPAFGVPGNGYGFENAHWGWETIAPLMDRSSPLRSTHIRDPYGLPILFGSEGFLDEVAVATGKDPIAFRLPYVKAREHELFAAAARQYGWDTRPSPRNDQSNADVAVGRGFAYRQLAGTYVALIVEVRVNRTTGAIEIPRLVCAHDCGLIVNPEVIRHVIDRQLVWGTSRVMYEEVQFDQNMVTSVDWLTHPVIRMDGVPRSIEIVLINRPDEPSSGAAEMAIGPLPAAISNAVFDATGVRLHRVPFTPARVKAALARGPEPVKTAL